MKWCLTLAVLGLSIQTHAVSLSWFADRSNGCAMSLPDGYNQGDISWRGSCVEGLAQGRGFLSLDRTSPACQAEFEKGTLVGDISCPVQNVTFYMRFVEGIPVKSWFIKQGGGFDNLRISADGKFTTEVISSEESEDYNKWVVARINASKAQSGKGRSSNQGRETAKSENNTQENKQSQKTSTQTPLESYVPASGKCPTTVVTYRATNYGLVPDDTVNKPIDWFYAKGGERVGWAKDFIFPNLSIPTPITNEADLYRLSAADWAKMAELFKGYFMGNMQGVDRSSEFGVTLGESYKANFQEQLKVMNCYAAVAAKREKSTQAKQQEKQKDSDKAPYTSSGVCAQFKQLGSGISDSFRKIVNICNYPIKVLLCLSPSGDAFGCSPVGGRGWGAWGNIPARGESVFADTVVGKWRVKYYECDMSDPKKQRCELPENPKTNIPRTQYGG